jgi:hypothetical protein
VIGVASHLLDPLLLARICEEQRIALCALEVPFLGIVYDELRWSWIGGKTNLDAIPALKA